MDSTLSEFGVDGDFIAAHSSVKDQDPFTDNKSLITNLLTILEMHMPNATTIHHNLQDGRTICLYKDKKSTIWYRWKLQNCTYSKQVRLG